MKKYIIFSFLYAFCDLCGLYHQLSEIVGRDEDP